MDYNKIEDSIFKKAMEVFQESAVKFFGINAKIIRPAQTEIKNIEIKTNYMDYLFYLEDGSYLHFEFQTTDKKDDISRFMYYDASLFYTYKKKITTIVIYSSDIENVHKSIDAGTIKYNIHPFYMGKINGDEKLEHLNNKIINQEPFTKQDILSLTFLPLMKSTDTKSERIIKSIELSEKIKDQNIKLQSQSMLYALFDKFGDESSKNKFREMIEMTEIGKMLLQEGFEKGKEEGKEEGKKEGKKEGKHEGKTTTLLKLLTKKFGKVPPEYTQKIKELPEDTIDIITLSIFEMNDVKELEKYF